MKKITFRMTADRTGLACAILLVFAVAAPLVLAEEVTKSFAVSGRGAVRVETNDGSVHVTTSDSPQVEFRVEYKGYILDKDLRVDFRQDGDKVEVTARASNHWGFSWLFQSRTVHIEVRMPRQADHQVETGDGSVGADYQNGTVDIHTRDGSISVDGLKGNIRLRTGDGSIEARGLDGKVEADSGDGHIRLAGRFDALDVKTGDGGIDARVQSGSKMDSRWTVRSGDGGIDLYLPADFQADIDASTGDGRVSLEIPVTVEGKFRKSEVRGRMNGGGQPLIIHTNDGSIRLDRN